MMAVSAVKYTSATMVNTLAGAIKSTSFSSSPLLIGLAIHTLIDELLRHNAQEWKCEMLKHLKTAVTSRVGPSAPLGDPRPPTVT